MSDPITDKWLADMKVTMATELSRGMTHGLPPKALIELLFGIPEVAQAFHLRGRSRLGLDIDTPEGQTLMAERIEQVADFLDDGFHEDCVTKLREVAGDLGELG